MMEALVADESRFVRFARQGIATGCFRQKVCRPGGEILIGFARETAYFGPKTREVFTEKKEVFTNPARYHCFLSRFDHRDLAAYTACCQADEKGDEIPFFYASDLLTTRLKG
jgi:hypothetical protein